LITLISAVSENGVIGKDNDLPWHIPTDLKRFQELTSNQEILMGRLTYESIARRRTSRNLPPLLGGGRKTLIFSQRNRANHTPELEYSPLETYEFPPEAQVFSTKQAILDYVAEQNLEKPSYNLFVIGGAKVYDLLLPEADTLMITRVKAYVEGDSFFPEINELEWKLESIGPVIQTEKDSHPVQFEKWGRIL
jgi:dihydrofolate reductase